MSADHTRRQDRADDLEDAMKKKYETICGCYVTNDGIQFCSFHCQTAAYVNELNFVRGYFLEHGGGDESPFVQRIDELLPRAGK